ncbi:PREDICTED: BTB/POZ domain-containing protein At3g56230 [Nelumbo nucifera]|uniref:BTB/POZ domain-containing protein At3g56230 n=1 Tax=Nelumbo nucifera TaxID=4432 RepID=A0A1U8A6E4_NELNU|nr:PREDICTED: BTB/POZ domain-containing protein At3g56230 [Nelumbo nucifera]
MDCSVCSPVPIILRPHRNTICPACYEGVRSIMSFLNKLELDKCIDNKSNAAAPPAQSNSSKGIANALKWMKEMKEIEEGLNEKLAFLSELVVAFRDGVHTDIQVKPGNGPAIPAHRALLASKSNIFKNMLESDGCKAPPNDTICLPELNHEELESLLEFLYSGSLPIEKIDKHVYSLSMAADKYEIPFLQKFCEQRMLESLDSSNVLDVLEISEVCSNQLLKETALNLVVKHMEDVIFSTRYDAFAFKNPHLSVQITRALLIEMKNRKSVD